MRKRAKGGWKARWSCAGGRAKESKAERIAFPPAALCLAEVGKRGVPPPPPPPGMEAEHAGCRAGLLLPPPLRSRAAARCRRARRRQAGSARSARSRRELF